MFDESRYFDVEADYAKASPNDLLIRLAFNNRGPDSAALEIAPKLFFRNTWIWGCEHEGCTLKPSIRKIADDRLQLDHQTLRRFYFEADRASDGTAPDFGFTENETNTETLYGEETYTKYVKDGIERWVVGGDRDAINPQNQGTIASPRYSLNIASGESVSIAFRLYSEKEAPKRVFGKAFDSVFAQRIDEANAFYDSVAPKGIQAEELSIQRQAYAGLLWTKQFYHYSVHDWLRGDPEIAKPPQERWEGRNHDWEHLFNRDVISMPDKWEYPWYAAWDLAFHMIPFARIDADFARSSLSYS